ncbi:hypothetical protein WA158_005908 [Blastocystis sp. Blastoise]
MKNIIVLTLFILAIANAITCTSPKSAYSIKRTYAGDAHQEYIYIYEGSATGTLVFQKNGINMANSIQTYEVCLKSGQHTFVATDGGSNGWGNGSRFELINGRTNVILEGTLDFGSRKEWTMYLGDIVPEVSFWKYSAVPQGDNSWTTSSVSTTWQSYVNGNFPASSSMTRYFTMDAYFPSNLPESIAIYEIGVKSGEGIIIYVNGVETYRFNLPTGVITSNTAVVATETALYRRVTGLFKDISSNTKVTISVEIHGADLTPKAEDFVAYMYLVDGPQVTRTHDGSINSNHMNDWDSQRADKAFDDDINTEWFYNALPAWIDYNFDNSRKETINRYSITCGVVQTPRRPSSWKVEGTNDDETYVLLDYRTNMNFPERGFTMTFDLNTNKIAYKTYRFTVLTSLNNHYQGELAEIQYYGANKASVAPVLSYSSSNLVLIANMDTINEYPAVTGFTSFTMTPDISEGLSFDNSTGLITGTPSTSIPTQSYVITAIYSLTGETQTATVSITVSECVAPNVRIDLEKYTASNVLYGYDEYFDLYNNQNQLIATHKSQMYYHDSDYYPATQTWKYCLPGALYKIKAYGVGSDGWSGNSRLTTTIYNGYTSYNDHTFTLYQKKSDEFLINAKFETPVSTFGLFNQNANPLENWYLPTFISDGWTPIVDNTPVGASNGVWYIRQTYTISDLANINSWEYQFTMRAGIIVYLDGEEIYRNNLHADAVVAFDSFAYSGVASTEAYVWGAVTGTMAKMTVGTHVFAIAYVNKAGYTAIEADFIGKLHLLASSNKSSRTNYIGIWVTNEANPDDAAQSHVFDHDHTSHWISTGSTSSPVEVRGRFAANRLETINKYCITKARYGSNADPMSFKIVASKFVTSVWTTLDEHNDIEWNNYSETRCFIMPFQTTAYYQYKIQITKTPSLSGGKMTAAIAEWEWFTVDYTNFVVPEFAYTTSSYVAYKDISMSNNNPTTEYFRDFTITPALPAGITLSASTGKIGGIPTAVAPQTTYTITAVNVQNIIVSTSIVLTVAECVSPLTPLVLSFTGMSTGNTQEVGFALLDVSGNYIVQVPRFSNWQGDMTYSFCTTSSKHYLVLYDQKNDGWSNQKVAVSFGGVAAGSYSCGNGEAPKTITIAPGFGLEMGAATWKYTSPSTAPAAEWKLASFDDADWSQAVSGSFTDLTATTAYYRYKMNIINLDGYNYFEFSLKLKAGCIALVGIFHGTKNKTN